MKRHIQKQRYEKTSLNIVVTGASRGLGKHLTQHLVKKGHTVIPLSRYSRFACDVSDAKQVQQVLSKLSLQLDSIDLWINNAGQSGGARNLADLSQKSIDDIIRTNLLGTAVCCKEVHRVMKDQPLGGAIFNLAGAGSDFNATPGYSIYGATKAGIIQLTKSLQKEWKDSNVDLHVISPGMMITDLLLDNMSSNTYNTIKFICTEPDEVAEEIIPKIETAYYHKENDYIRFLTVPKIIEKVSQYLK